MCGPRGGGTVRDVVATRVTVCADHPRAVRTRVAWLLRSLRRCATDPEVLIARRFAAAFPHSARSRGVAPSQVTRWENGRTRVGYAVLRGYERALGLERRSLVAVVDSCLRQDAGTIGAPAMARGSERDEAVRQHQLLELVERADSTGPMSSLDWDDLTALLSGWWHPGLRARDWAMLAARLGSELCLAEGVVWLRRQEALLRMVGHPSGGPPAIAACADLVADVTNPLRCDILLSLDGARHPAASRLVLDQLSVSDTDAVRGALIVGLQKLRRGHFGPPHLPELFDRTAELVDATELSQHVRLVAAELLRNAPEPHLGSTRTRLVRAAANDQTVAALAGSGRLARAETVGAHARELVDAASGCLAAPPPPQDVAVLTALVEDMLYHPDVGARFFATQWLAASPYRASLGAALGRHLRRSEVVRTGTPAVVALEALTFLGGPTARRDAERLATATGLPATVSYSAVRALAHLPGRTSAPVWQSVLTHAASQWRRSKAPMAAATLDRIVYALGIAAATPVLRQIIADATLPAGLRRTASWWVDRPKRILADARV
jgi:hypothetical protein